MDRWFFHNMLDLFKGKKGQTRAQQIYFTQDLYTVADCEGILFS